MERAENRQPIPERTAMIKARYKSKPKMVRALAERDMEISSKTIENWERGDPIPNKIHVIAAAFDKTVLEVGGTVIPERELNTLEEILEIVRRIEKAVTGPTGAAKAIAAALQGSGPEAPRRG